MKILFHLLAATTLFALSTVPVFAQSPAADAKQFAKDGLSFSYPNGWTLKDESNEDAQNFNIGRADSEAQFRVFVYRTPVNSPARLAEARKVLVDPYVASTVRQFEQMGAKPQKTPGTVEIAKSAAEGVRVGASLDGIPGAAEIYWVVVGNRLVVLTALGPDRALKQAAPAWELIRSSIAVAEEKPSPKPTPTPAPTPSPK
ncbi:MAG TPA: hypothetical protein VJV03_04380 [Pyrinomonadaceae bacterium]|nr:hypothetical protein [Pyrinomonadaceae bacterium]